MCIRDSPGPDRSCGLLPVGEQAQIGSGKGLLDRGAWQEGCLLYTSDAADERSSVDLGGRRIIKKKIRTQGQGRP